MKEEREEMNEKMAKLEESNQKLEHQVQSQEQESSGKEKQLEARVEYFSSHKALLEQKVGEMSKQINTLQEALTTKRQQTTSDETKWDTEKEELYKNLTDVSEILEEKEKLHSQQLKSLEDGYKTSLEVLDKRIKMLNDEKRQLEKQLKVEKDDVSMSI